MIVKPSKHRSYNSDMNSIQFNIKQIYALSSGRETPEDWALWYQQKENAQNNSKKASADAIPMMMRRRMSDLSKLAVQVAVGLSQIESVDFIVFSSQHGELQRTIHLLQDIVAGEDASPTAFSLSVHNTASGLFTIATEQAVPASSLAGGQDSFHYALIEAALYLGENPNKTVLVVDFDAPLPSPYCSFEHFFVAPYALGLVLRAGSDIHITRKAFSSNASNASKNTLPQALQWYAHWLTQKGHLTIKSADQKWDWTMLDIPKTFGEACRAQASEAPEHRDTI